MPFSRASRRSRAPGAGGDARMRRKAGGARPGVSVRCPEGRAVFLLEDAGYRSVRLAGDFNDWGLAGDPMAVRRGGRWRVEKRGLLSGTHRYKYVIDGERWIPDPANPRVETDRGGWTNSLFTVPRSTADRRFIASVEAALARTPPRWGRRGGRRAALGMLDAVLLREGAAGMPAVRRLFVRRLANLLERFRREPVRSGWRVSHLYNHGFIVETPGAAVGFDVVTGRGVLGLWWDIPPGLAAALAARLDALLVSHRHLDHLDVELVARMRAAGKPVILPAELSCLFASGARHASPGALLDLPCGVRVRAHDGRHVYDGGRGIPTRYYEAEFPGGPRVLHLGDHDYTSGVRRDGPVDLLIPKCGGISPDGDDFDAVGACVAAVGPARVLAGHLFEVGHPAREGRTGIAAACRMLEGGGAPFEALFWGEGIRG